MYMHSGYRTGVRRVGIGRRKSGSRDYDILIDDESSCAYSFTLHTRSTRETTGTRMTSWSHGSSQDCFTVSGGQPADAMHRSSSRIRYMQPS